MTTPTDNDPENTCQHCGRKMAEWGCRWSDCPDNAYTCPACGYVYSAYDEICPRCYGRG